MAAETFFTMRASTADRDRSIEVLKASFAEGRLSWDEFEVRIGQVLVTPFFAQLMALTADLPAGPFGRLPGHPVTPAPGPRYPRLRAWFGRRQAMWTGHDRRRGPAAEVLGLVTR